jgi:hypothetical protein
MRGEAVPNISPISNPCSRGQFEKINGSSSSFDNSRDMEKSSVKILIGEPSFSIFILPKNIFQEIKII